MADKRADRRIIAAADASFLVGVCAIGKTSLLEAMCDRLYVAPAVWDEVVLHGSGRAGAEEFARAGFIQRHPVRDQQAVAMVRVFLGAGEAEPLALAQELSSWPEPGRPRMVRRHCSR